MAADLRLIGMKARGLRCPDYDLSFLDASHAPYPIVLIQMPNGTGKTTTLQLLRAALAGKPFWEQEMLRVRDVGRPGFTGEGLFQVQLLHDGKRYTIEMQFDFEHDDVQYRTTLPGGVEAGLHPPPGLQPFFRPDFVKLFVFDGELATHLLDTAYTDAERAISALFQLDLFQQIQQALHDYYDHQTARRGAETAYGFKRRRSDVQKIAQRLETVEQAQQRDLKELNEAKTRLKQLRKQYDHVRQTDEAFNQRVQQARDAATAAKKTVERLRTGVLEQVRDPHALHPAFAREMLALKQHLDRVKLPESASREFFRELAEEPHCVCGTPIDAQKKQAILTRAERYLGSEAMNLLNAMKTDVAEAVGVEPTAQARALAAQIEALQAAMEQEDAAKEDVRRIETEGARDNPDLESLIRERTVEEQRVKKLEDQMVRYTAPDDEAPPDLCWSLPVLQRHLRKAEDLLAEVANTITLKTKRDVLHHLLDRALVRANALLAEQVREEANARIRTLMPNNHIRIRSVQKSLLLEGQRGGSQGETLAVAYAFLSTLFNRASVKLPFVVDSPAGPIDLAVREEIGRLVPMLAEQFVAFTISSERPAFVPALAAATPKPVLYLTLFRKGHPSWETLARQEKQFFESENGVWVAGKPFFDRFQLDRDDVDPIPFA